jgi:hypothetical protein
MTCDLLLFPLRGNRQSMGLTWASGAQNKRALAYRLTWRLLVKGAGRGLCDVTQPRSLVDRDDQVFDITMKQACDCNGRFFSCSTHAVDRGKASSFPTPVQQEGSSFGGGF